MERPRQMIPAENAKLDELQKQADERFGAGALFEYPTPKGATLLTFEEARAISGSHMVGAPEDDFWEFLEMLNANAQGYSQRIEAGDASAEIEFDAARTLGREVLSRYQPEG